MVVDVQDIAERAFVEPKSFGAKQAITAFLFGLLAQIATTVLLAIVVGMYLGALMAMKGLKSPDPAALSAQIQKIIPMPAAIISALVGAYVVFRIIRPCFPGLRSSGAMAPLGWCVCSRKMLWYSAAMGMAISSMTLVLSKVFPPPDGQLTGPLAAAAVTAGWQRFSWAVLAILVAPPVEEFVFRGVLYSGLEKSWGKVAAAVVVTLLFMAMHLTEIRSYWPALLGISLLAIGTLVVRRISGSLVSAITLHVAYNLGLVIFVYASSGR
jgi:membrane protease YdiL (CAAX protease family)